MKNRAISIVLTVAMLLSLAACGEVKERTITCPDCDEDIARESKFCSECGYDLSEDGDDEEPGKDTEIATNWEDLTTNTNWVTLDEEAALALGVPQEDNDKINQALDAVNYEWLRIANEDEANNGYFAIRNTRIIWPDSNDIAEALEVDGVECIVEFVIFTDYYGAAPYYIDTQYRNNVVFFSDGTLSVTENVVAAYRAATYDFTLDNIAYSVTDYRDLYNRAYNLKGPIDNIPAENKNPAENESPAVGNELPLEDDEDYTILDSGRCNENVRWEIRSNGVLYIYGTGTVPNYENREIDGPQAPWRESAVSSKITDVIVSDGITGFGEESFHGMWLSSLYFGHDVIAYDYSVSGSMAVDTVYIPSAMEDIDLFLLDSYHGNHVMTIYYEGTKEEWDSIVRYNVERYAHYDIHYNYEYN